MFDRLASALAKLPEYLGGHMLLSTAALAVGMAISIPLGIAASRRPKLSEFTLGVAGIIQTVPSLALLALTVPLLGGKIGFAPAFIVLTLYSILPALANTITGIRGVDPSLTEAARGLGMSDKQMLFRVQLPLALPVIIAGVRTATVLVVGSATLVTPVGGKSLGNYIFQGLNTGNQVSVAFGCVVTALLAIVMDQLIRLLEIAAQRHSRVHGWIGACGLLLVLGGGLYEPLAMAFSPGVQRATVGNLEFTEQHILGEVLAERLRSAGFDVELKKGLAENIQFQALCDGSIDCCVEYTGNIWAREMKRTDFADRQTTLNEITRWLAEEYGVVCLGPLGFENAYALAMPEAKAKALNISSIRDLRGHARNWEIGGDMQIFDPRPEWTSVKNKYQLNFARERSMDPTRMYPAVSAGEVQVICAYTSDGRIRKENLRLLTDPEQAFPPYDAVLLLSHKAAARPDLVHALKPLIGAIDLTAMQQANLEVDVNGQSPARAAQSLLQLIATQKATPAGAGK
jgi:osmoprotectant transport system permease protein